jgi:hypothetical protein
MAELGQGLAVPPAASGSSRRLGTVQMQVRDVSRSLLPHARASSYMAHL